jgi:hypothetical protein
LALTTPVLASAGSSGPGTTSSKGSKAAEAAYLAARHTIQVEFRAAVTQARTTYQSALAVATTSAQRSAARQVFEAAIIQAATNRSAALTLLGPDPASVKSGGTQGKTS